MNKNKLAIKINLFIIIAYLYVYFVLANILLTINTRQ